MTGQAMGPFGLALWDCFRDMEKKELYFVREDGYVDAVPVDRFFATCVVSPIERRALDLCRGRVLDIGAGAGRLSLALQVRGLEVEAIDIVPQAVAIMQERGVRNATCIDLYACEGSFDTVLVLCHGLGLAQNLTGLKRMLEHLSRIIAPEGQILADSLDVRRTKNPRHLAYQRSLEEAGGYAGEMRFHMRYGDVAGPEFGWLHVDFQTLSDIATECGWRAACLLEEETGDYLCQLVRA